MHILSEYVLCNGRQPLLRRWACSLFLYHGMFENLAQGKQFGRCNTQFLCRLLGIARNELQDEETLFTTLSDMLNNEREAGHDESDPFCINTRWIQTAMGLGETELSLLRFYLIATANCGIKEALEVSCFDEAGDPLSEAERIGRYRLGQYMFGRSGSSMFVFDEVEGILCDVSYALYGIQGSDKPIGKAALNALLEHNRVPAIWISNTIAGIDPAYLRRFDFCLQVELPKGDAARRLTNELLREVPVGACLLRQITEHPNIAPAALQKAGQIYQTLGDHGSNANMVVSQILNSDLQARGVASDQLLDPEPIRVSAPAYCLEYLNGDCDIEALTGSISSASEARLCLYGPPGTGKTAWARHHRPAPHLL